MKSLVVIDDEALLVRGISTMLEKEGLDYQVTGAAGDGLTGLSLIREKKPDVAFVDIRMPGMDGLELIEKAKKEFPELVFVIISGYKKFEYARKGLELGVCAYLDKPVTRGKLRSALKAAEEAMGKNTGAKGIYPKENLGQRLAAVQQEIIELVGQKKAGDGMERVNEYLWLLEAEETELAEIRNRCFQFLCTVLGIFYEQWKNYEKELAFPSYQNVVNLQTKEEVEEYTRTLFARIFDKISARSLGSSHRIILQILDYINENYRRDIGLSELADMVKMTPGYLSILFKDEVGVTYVKYLTNVRMDHARELLREGYKVSQVSEMVGYSNYRYFCDVFKREVGKTPTEYRGNIRKR